MIKKNINIIDFDETLIPYDSFRFLIKEELIKLDLFVIWFTFLRVARLISMKKYKKHLVKYLQKKHKTEYFKRFADKLFLDINKEVLNLIAEETEENTINILVSASPNLFVKYVIKKLNWEGKGSYFDREGIFIHLYNKNKISWLKENYKLEDYNYNFAISDSSTDDELLSLFNKKNKWIVK